MLENAQTQFQNIGYQLGAAQCLKSLGDICYTQGKFLEAQTILENAQTQFQNIGNQLGVAQCLQSLGDTCHMQGIYSASQNCSNVEFFFNN